MGSNRHSKTNEDLKLVISVSLAIVVVLAVFFIVIKPLFVKDKPDNTNNSSQDIVSEVTSSQTESADETSKAEESEVPKQTADGKLDENYKNLFLVNAENPLPKDYDYESDLVTIEDKYKNGQLNQINKYVWPYMKAMIEAAWADGVDLKVWSPYRSYSTQEMLFENQVKRCMDKGLDRATAETEAATVVARPGTSEHNTGLAADFNMASDRFESTPMFEWMKNNAENYGFIMRYSKEKQPLTGVIHESWHWRFVGIKTAKEINKLGMCLEEYVEYKKK